MSEETTTSVLEAKVSLHDTQIAIHSEQIASLKQDDSELLLSLKDYRIEVSESFREQREEVSKLRHTIVAFALTYAAGIAGLIATLLKVSGTT